MIRSENERKCVEIVIVVKDCGVGISSDDMKNLFQPFYIATETTNKEKNRYGHGLGLSICNKILCAMGGEI